MVPPRRDAVVSPPPPWLPAPPRRTCVAHDRTLDTAARAIATRVRVACHCTRGHAYHTIRRSRVLHRTRLIEEETRHCDEADEEEEEEDAAALDPDRSVGENEDPAVPAPPLALLKRLRSSSGFAAQSSSALKSMRFTQRRAKSLAALPRSSSAVVTSALKRRDDLPREHLSMRRLAGRRPPPPPIVGALPVDMGSPYRQPPPARSAPGNNKMLTRASAMPAGAGSPYRSAPGNDNNNNSPGLFSPGSPSLCV